MIDLLPMLTARLKNWGQSVDQTDWLQLVLQHFQPAVEGSIIFC